MTTWNRPHRARPGAELHGGVLELTNQYTFIEDDFQSYDLSGNLLNDGTWSYQYNASNQLVRADDGITDVRYRFDVMGRRVSKRMGSGNFPGWSYGHSVYVCFGSRILEEVDTAGALRKEWVYGIGIDETLRQVAPDYADLDGDLNVTETVDLYYLSNSLGSVVALVDSSANVVERYDMDVWGVMRDVIDDAGASTGASWTLVGNPWTYTGRQFEFEERTGLYHYRARAYRPGLGQFLRRDPVGVWHDGWSLGSGRVYVGGNPANLVDPSGLTALPMVYLPSMDLDQTAAFASAWSFASSQSIAIDGQFVNVVSEVDTWATRRGIILPITVFGEPTGAMPAGSSGIFWSGLQQFTFLMDKCPVCLDRAVMVATIWHEMIHALEWLAVTETMGPVSPDAPPRFPSRVNWLKFSGEPYVKNGAPANPAFRELMKGPVINAAAGICTGPGSSMVASAVRQILGMDD